MEKGSLGAKFQDRTNPMDKHMEVMMRVRGFEPVPPAPQMFGNAGREHMDKVRTPQCVSLYSMVDHYVICYNAVRNFIRYIRQDRGKKSPPFS